MTARADILAAMRDPALFAPWFRDADTWRAWRAFLAALFGLPMGEDAMAVYRACTGRTEAPSGFSEAALIVGRRGGKSFILAVVAVYLAMFRDWRPHLAPGERGIVMVIATDRRQARVIMRYVTALIEGVPMLARFIERQTGESMDLGNRVSIEVHTASFRSIRGYTVVAALLDELAFWRSEDAANPDAEILAALRPAMATVPGAMLLCASSPYARRGELWRMFREHHGRDDAPVLVWRADTRTMNPSVPERVIAEAYERDPASAAAEYGAEFRSDIETFIAREAVEACQRGEPLELPPVAGQTYAAFVDPSGGASDAMTLAIGHRDRDGRAVVDVVRERRPPFSPEAVVAEFAALLRDYRVGRVTGDRYAGEWPRERFREHGITYDPAAKAKSDLYLDLLAVVNSGRVELPPDPRMAAQLVNLERRTSRAGKDTVDHAPGGYDDVANAVAGAAHLLAASRRRWGAFGDCDDPRQRVDSEGVFLSQVERGRAVFVGTDGRARRGADSGLRRGFGTYRIQ